MASSSLSRLSANLGKSSKDFLVQSYSIKNVPLRIRPVILVTLATWVLILGVLGMAPIPEVPINDKVLHFFGMGTATFLLYFIIDVPDSSRRIWYYRRAPMIITLSVGFIGGGILSEVAQGYLPWKTFQWGDIAANLAGCSLAYCSAHTLLQHHRRHYEISRLYLPISSSTNSNERFNGGNGSSGGHMSSSHSRSAYIQPGHGYGHAHEGARARDRSESVDTELGAWDAERYYYSGGGGAGAGAAQAQGGTAGGGGGRVYDDTFLDDALSDEEATDSKQAAAAAVRAGGGEYANVFDLGEEEEEDTLSGGQHT